jgi:hypothetical protein
MQRSATSKPLLFPKVVNKGDEGNAHHMATDMHENKECRSKTTSNNRDVTFHASPSPSYRASLGGLERSCC